MLGDVHYMRRYLPAGWAGLSVLYDFFGLNPHGYHFASMVMHGMNALLVFAICREIIKKFQPGRKPSDWAGFSAALAGAWWAWHPLRVETVAWASGYLYVQAGFFLLASFYLYITRDGKTNAGRGKLWLASGCYIVSISTYPLALAYPAVLLIWEAAGLQRRVPRPSREWWRQFRGPMLNVLGWFGLPAIGLGVMTVYASYHADASVWGRPPSLETQGYVARLSRAIYAWGYYLWKPWWPVREKLVQNPVINPAWHEPRFLLCLLVLMGMAVVCFRTKFSRRSGIWSIGAAYLIFLVPMLGLTEKAYFVGDRYSYLVSLPWAVALALAVNACTKPLFRWVVGLGLVLLLGVFFIFTRQQLVARRDSATFFKAALDDFHHPDDEKELIYFLWANSLRMKGLYDQARMVCAQGLEEFSGSKRLNQQKLEIEETAEITIRQARALGLAVPVSALALSHVSIAERKCDSSQWREAADHLRAALQASPDYYPAQLKLAEVLTMQGKPDEALSCYLRAAALANGHIANAERAHFLFMLASASALKDEGRLARIAFDKGQELRVKASR
jgi:tetratricopeptide (TPR) repeat protein